VDRRHPLTARVVVNRYWAHFFGRGLVATPGDFGVRGAPPSHPDLLDWLAVEFMESGWDVKYLVRLIVTSNTYRQAHRLTPDLKQVDPQNILLARGPRVRLSGETIRDSGLFVGGLLSERLGGPSVNPRQPADLWKDLAYDATTLTAQSFQPGQGSDLYRRSLYTFWKRTAPHPLLAVFDAPNRETCTVERTRSTSPLQALALLNDISFVEAARGLAERMLREVETSSQARTEYLFRSVLTRSPTPRERQRLIELFEQQLAAYESDPEAAAELVGTKDAQLAAWTTVANALFNLEEFLVH
jgi:hypothetical protein